MSSFDNINVEAAMIIAIADPSCVGSQPMTDEERAEFRLGFLAGARFALDVVRKDIQETFIDTPPKEPPP